MKFHAPLARVGDQHAPANTLRIRRVAFAVDDIAAVVAGLWREPKVIGAEDAARADAGYSSRHYQAPIRRHPRIDLDGTMYLRPRYGWLERKDQH
jgi:hypothetical protein